MSIVKANAWVTSDQRGNEIYAGAPVKIQQFVIPQSTTSFSGGYILLSAATTSNTGSMYSFTYTPKLSSSMITYQAFLACDRTSNANAESLWMFINGSAHSVSFTYPRVSSQEPWQSRGLSGVFENTSSSNITFNIRGRNGGGWTQYIGTTVGGTQIMSNTVQVIEYQKVV